MRAILILCFVTYTTAVVCPPAQFCEKSPIGNCTTCTKKQSKCGPTNIKYDKVDMTYLRYRASPICCCADICLSDVDEVPCDGVEYHEGRCHLVTAVSTQQWPFVLQRTVSPVYLKTEKCNAPTVPKQELGLSPMIGYADPLRGHFIGIEMPPGTPGGLEEKGFFTCFATMNVTQCDMVPVGTDAEYRELIVGGPSDKPMGYCTRTKGMCGATESLHLHTVLIPTIDRVYRVPGFPKTNLNRLKFEDQGPVPCYFWPNEKGLNC